MALIRESYFLECKIHLVSDLGTVHCITPELAHYRLICS
jgi:hypothetical protein